MASALGEFLSDGLAAPLGSVIAAVGRGVADAQQALDAASLAQTLAIFEAHGNEGEALLREIGYRPTFYVLPETTCEVQLSLRVSGSGGSDGGAAAGDASGLGAARTYVTPVDAGFANRYGFQAQAAAKLTFKILPVPPPAALDDLRTMPNVVGLTVAAAMQALQGLDITGRVVDSGGTALTPEQASARTVTQQSVAAARLVRAPTEVVLTVAQV